MTKLQKMKFYALCAIIGACFYVIVMTPDQAQMLMCAFVSHCRYTIVGH